MFSTEITNSKRKRKRSLAHTSIDHAKTKQTKTEKNTIQEKQVSNTEILENLKTVLNHRIHFYHNGHDPITIRNSFHDSIKDDPKYICSSSTQMFFKHFVQRVDRIKFKHKDVQLPCLTGYKSVNDKE